MSGITPTLVSTRTQTADWYELPAQHWNHTLSFLSPHDAVRFIKIGTKVKDRPEGLKFRKATKSATKTTFANALWQHNFQSGQEYLATLDEGEQKRVLSHILGELANFYAHHLDEWASLPNLTKRLFLMYLRSFREPGLGENALGAYSRPMTACKRAMQYVFFRFSTAIAFGSLIMYCIFAAINSNDSRSISKGFGIAALAALPLFIGALLYTCLSSQRAKKKYNPIFARAQWERAAIDIPINRRLIFDDYESDAPMAACCYVTQDPFYNLDMDTFDWKNLNTISPSEGIYNLSELIRMCFSKTAVYRIIELALADVRMNHHTNNPHQFLQLMRCFRTVNYDPMTAFVEITEQKILTLRRQFFRHCGKTAYVRALLLLGIFFSSLTLAIKSRDNPGHLVLGLVIASLTLLVSSVIYRSLFDKFTNTNCYQHLERDIKLVTPYFKFSAQAKRVIANYELQREENATKHPTRYAFFLQKQLFSVDTPERRTAAIVPI